MARLGEEPPLGHAYQPGGFDDARWRAAEARCFQAGLQVWAARCRWSLSQEAASHRELERAETRLWLTIKAALQIRPERKRWLLSEETEDA